MGPYGLMEETREINTLSTASPSPVKGDVQMLHFVLLNRNTMSEFNKACLLFHIEPECPQHVQRVEKDNTASSVGSSLTRATGNGINSTEDARSISDV